MIQTSDIVIYMYLSTFEIRRALFFPMKERQTAKHYSFTSIIITIQFGTHQVKVLGVRQGFRR